MYLGTSSFTAKGWEGAFYPRAIARSRWLEYYASRYPAVEVDSSFYGVPDPATVARWNELTPSHFRFAFKAPQSITHHKRMRDAAADLDELLYSVDQLGEKLGPILFQFPYFKRREAGSVGEFLASVASFLEHLPPGRSWAVEMRNAEWIRVETVEFLAERHIALALADHPYLGDASFWVERLGEEGIARMPFLYIRLLGDRYAIEERTKVWYRVIEDRALSLDGWAELITRAESLPAARPGFVFANNHYEGFAPGTLERLRSRLAQQNSG